MGVFIFLKIDDHDIRSLSGKRDRCGTADSGVPAGDECRAACKPTASFQLRILMPGRGVHLILSTGLFVLRLGWALGLLAVAFGFICHAAAFADAVPTR